MIRECAGCGTQFETQNLRRTLCRKNCGRSSGAAHRARTASRERHDMTFIGVDGEADTTQPGDPYVLLSVGNKSLDNGGHKLTHHEIFPFLWECFQDNPDAAYVGFFLGYDFAQWLKSISVHEAFMLLTKEGIAKRARTESGGNTMPFPVYVDDWEIDLLDRKRFKLKPRGKGSQWMYVCDVGSFFQTSLLNAIDPKQWDNDPVCTDEEYAEIVRGKTTRDDAAFGPEMIRYNVLENEVLARMMDRLNRGFTAIDVRLPKHKWFGPGQAAQSWMGMKGAPTSVEIQESVPAEILTMARESYYGGWFEVLQHGNIPGKVYEYDINSAYPHAMRSLPCFLHGRWEPGTLRTASDFRKLANDRIGLVRARVYGSNPYVGTMLHRDSKQRIMRPHATSGTYWVAELAAAVRAGLVDRIDVSESYLYSGCDCAAPLRDVAGLYQQRLDVGKETVHGKACKLVYNSMYGKTAQSAGKPKFANPLYASLITSTCRSMILDAIATHPDGTAGLVMVATDGVYFRTPHPTLELDKGVLGKWDAAVLENLTILKPGVYWSDKNREAVRRNEGFKLKSRGISARDLAARMFDFDAAFHTWKPGDSFPCLDIDVAFSVISPKVAIQRGKWEMCGQSIRHRLVKVDSDPSPKRDTTHMVSSQGAWVSQPYAVPPSGILESLPYQKSFGMVEDERELSGDTPDGQISTVFNALLER